MMKKTGSEFAWAASRVGGLCVNNKIGARVDGLNCWFRTSKVNSPPFISFRSILEKPSGEHCPDLLVRGIHLLILSDEKLFFRCGRFIEIGIE